MNRPPAAIVGHYAIRDIAGVLEVPLKITEITDDRIICGPWEFDLATGAEIDEELGWGAPPKMTGSRLTGFRGNRD